METVKNDLQPKVKKKSTSKSVIIDGQLHADMKKYCTGTKRKIGGVIENLIRLYLANPKQTENLIDNLNDNT
jgi:hypothetical protein